MVHVAFLYTFCSFSVHALIFHRHYLVLFLFSSVLPALFFFFSSVFLLTHFTGFIFFFHSFLLSISLSSISLTVTPSLSHLLTHNFSISSLSAGDYSCTNRGPYIFDNRNTRFTVRCTITQDAVVEGSEEFDLRLSSSTTFNVSLSPDRTIVRIQDDDSEFTANKAIDVHIVMDVITHQ